MQFLIVEDHYFVAEAVGNALNAMPDVSGVDHVVTVDAAIAYLNANPNYQLIVMDLQLDGRSGFDALDVLRERFSNIPVLVFSADHTRDSIERVYELGARGYVSKRAPMSELVGAIRIVLMGENYVSAQAAQILGNDVPQTDLGDAAIRRLSRRQKQILRRILRGEQNKLIARDLSIAIGTVKAHANAIYTRFGVSSRAQLVARASGLGLYHLLTDVAPSIRESNDGSDDEAIVA